MKLDVIMKMPEKYFLRTLSKYSKKKARKVNKFLDFDAGLNLLSVDCLDFGIPPSSTVHIASSKKDFKKSSKSDHEFISIPAKGYCSSMKMDLPRALVVEELSRCSKKEVF